MNLEQFVSPSHIAATKNDNCSLSSQTAATAHALITVNKPLNLPVSLDASSPILMSTNSQYKTVQINNSSQANGQGKIFFFNKLI